MRIEFATPKAADGNQTDVVAVGEVNLPEGLQ